MNRYPSPYKEVGIDGRLGLRSKRKKDNRDKFGGIRSAEKHYHRWRPIISGTHRFDAVCQNCRRYRSAVEGKSCRGKK